LMPLLFESRRMSTCRRRSMKSCRPQRYDWSMSTRASTRRSRLLRRSFRSSTEELAEIKALKAENRRLREDVEILRGATTFFVGELDPRNR